MFDESFGDLVAALSPVEIHIWKEAIQVTERWGSFLDEFSGDTIDYLGKHGGGMGDSVV